MGRKQKHVQSRWQPLPDHATTMQALVIPDVDDHIFHPEELTKEDLLNCIRVLEQSNKSLEIENLIIEKYLRRMDPNALAKMSETLEAAAATFQKIEKTTIFGHESSATNVKDSVAVRLADDAALASVSPRRDTVSLSRSSKVGLLTRSDKSVRVPAVQKIDIVNRELEELKSAMEAFRKKARNYNYNLRCRNEELTERLQEITDYQNNFEQKLLIDGVDKITGKLPAEKFIRFLETRLKAEEMEIDKMRMKTAQLKSQLKKIRHQVAQKEELGEVLHAVDFEQLQIENRECQERLEERMAHVIDIKKINGNFVNLLNVHRKKHAELSAKLAGLEENLVIKEKIMKQMGKDEEKVSAEVATVQKAVNSISRLIKNYRGPEVIDYIKKKAELNDLSKEIKVCERKLKLKDLALSTKFYKMRNMHEEMSRTTSLTSRNIGTSRMLM